MIKQKVYLLLENLDQLRNLNVDFCLSVDTLGLHLFQLIFLLKPDFNYSSSFALA